MRFKILTPKQALSYSHAPFLAPQIPQNATSPALIYDASLQTELVHFHELCMCSGRRTLAQIVQVSECGGFSREQIGQIDGDGGKEFVFGGVGSSGGVCDLVVGDIAFDNSFLIELVFVVRVFFWIFLLREGLSVFDGPGLFGVTSSCDPRSAFDELSGLKYLSILSIPRSSSNSLFASSLSLSSSSQTLTIPLPFRSTSLLPSRSSASSGSGLMYISSSTSLSASLSVTRSSSLTSGSSFFMSKRANAAAARSSRPRLLPATLGLERFVFPFSRATFVAASSPTVVV